MLRNRLVPVAAALLWMAPWPAATTRADECAPKVEAAAEKTFAALVQAMRKADPQGVVALMAPGKDGRLTLRLSGVKPGAYPKEQATEVLKTAYFKTHEVLSLTEDEGCTRGSEDRLVRAYRMRVRSGGKEQDGTLTAVIQRGEPGWFLDILSDS